MSQSIKGGLPPPPGVVPNFINPPSEQPVIITVQVLCLVSSTAFVAARVYTKARILRTLGWDDCESLVFDCVSSRSSNLTFVRYFDFRMGMTDVSSNTLHMC